MIRSLTLVILLLVIFCSRLASQTTIYFGGGVEANNIHMAIEPPDGIVGISGQYAAAQVTSTFEKKLNESFTMDMMLRYANNEVVSYFIGNINPSTNTLGFHKFSVRPSVSKYWFDNLKSSVGLDVSILAGHYTRFNGRKLREDGWVDGINTQLGPYVSLGYRWKRFMVQADASFGLTYTDEAAYRNYIDVANYYGISVLYGLEVGKKKRR